MEESAGFPDAVVESKEYRVQFKTTAGSFNVTLDRALSPNGVDRFVELVKDGHFTDMLFYRVLPGFLIQFGVVQIQRSSASGITRWIQMGRRCG